MYIVELLLESTAPGTGMRELLPHPQRFAVICIEIEIKHELSLLVQNGGQGRDDIVIGVVFNHFLYLSLLEDSLVDHLHFPGKLDIFPFRELPYIPPAIAQDVKLGHVRVTLVSPKKGTVRSRNEDASLQGVHQIKKLFLADWHIVECHHSSPFHPANRSRSYR